MRGNTQNDAEDKRDKREEKLKRIRRDIDAQLRITGDTDVIEQDVANHFDISRAEAHKLIRERHQARCRRQEATRRRRQNKRHAAAGDSTAKLPPHMDPEKLAIVREKVEAMCLFDDMFFASCLKDNKEGAAEILRPVLHDPNLTVESMAIQDVIPGQPGERGVRLDLKVLTGDGKLRIVEVHRRITEDLPKEARYRAAREDVAQLPEGAEPSELRDVYVIYLCETDPYDDGLPMYHVKSTIEENEKPYEEGRYIIYVNGQYRGDDPVGRLMHDMRATNPEDIYSEALRERAVLSKSAVRGGKKLTMQQEAVRRDWLEAFDDIWDRHHDGEMTALRKGIMDRDKQIQDLEKQIQDLKKQVADRNKQTPDQGEQIQDLKKQVMDLTKLVAELLQSGSAQHGGSSEPDQE